MSLIHEIIFLNISNTIIWDLPVFSPDRDIPSFTPKKNDSIINIKKNKN